MKLGAALSKREFDLLKVTKTKSTLLSEYSSMSYEDYLKIREYTTATLKKDSSVDKNDLQDNTYFVLDTNKKGNLYIIGQYVDGDKVYPIKIDDCGVFKQDNYKAISRTKKLV